MTTISTGLYTYELADDPTTPPPTQTFYTRRIRLDTNRPVVEVATPTGDFIGRLTGEVGPVSWRIDGYGRLTMAMPPVTAASRRELIEYGNQVMVTWDNGLPPWIGVIDVPRENAPGRTTLNFYSMEYTLGWMLTRRYDVYRDEPPDHVLTRLIQLSGRSDIVAYGAAIVAEPVGEVIFSYDTLLEAAERLRERNERFHWFISREGRHVPRPSLWTYYGYRHDRRADVRLVEGYNLINVETVEQGPLFNDVTVAAGNDDPAADASGQQGLVYGIYRPSRHGRRERFVPLPEVTVDLTTGNTLAEIVRVLGPMAQAEYERYARPRLRYRGTCINRPPSKFGSYGLGDLVTVELNGFDRRRVELDVVVVGMEFDPESGLLTVVSEDFTGEQS